MLLPSLSEVNTGENASITVVVENQGVLWLVMIGPFFAVLAGYGDYVEDVYSATWGSYAAPCNQFLYGMPVPCVP